MAITGSIKDDRLPIGIEDFASICMEAIYVIDFFKRGFDYVAARDLFLCGHSVDEAMSLGFGFYRRIIHPDDMLLLVKMYKAIQRRLFGMSSLGPINYFSFSIRVKNRSKHIMIYHKFKPLYVDGQLRFGLCLLSNSVMGFSGHLTAHFCNRMDYEEYAFADRVWQRRIVQPLSRREAEILRLAGRGKTGRSAADILHISYQTLRHERTAIYKKLNVHSLMQALLFALHHQLIFTSENLQKKGETTPKRRRRLMTPDMILRIQEGLNKGQSVNSIAKREHIAEGSIRYAIGKGIVEKAPR